MTYTIPASVHFNHVNEEVVLMDETSDGYLALNEVGATIWTAIVDGLDAPAIASRVVARFEVDDQTASADVAEFLDVLVDRGLVAAT